MQQLPRRVHPLLPHRARLSLPQATELERTAPIFNDLFIRKGFVYDYKYDWVRQTRLSSACAGIPAAPKAAHSVQHTEEDAPEGGGQEGESESGNLWRGSGNGKESGRPPIRRGRTGGGECPNCADW
jgi:hypothetical protein